MSTGFLAPQERQCPVPRRTCVAGHRQILGRDAALRLPLAKARPRDSGRPSVTGADHELDPPPWPSGILGRTGPEYRTALSIPRIAKSTLENGR